HYRHIHPFTTRSTSNLESERAWTRDDYDGDECEEGVCRSDSRDEVQNRPEAVAINMTAGTKYAETLSARRWRGAFPTCASSTSLAICDRTVSCPTLVA